MSESIQLRLLANAIERLELMEGFNYSAGNGEFCVSWSVGSSCEGYRETSDAISRIVSTRYDELRSLAIELARKEVAQLRAELETRRANTSTGKPE